MTGDQDFLLGSSWLSEARRFLKISLEADGHTFAEAENGKEGLVTAAAQRPELIILDLGLPDMDGLAVLQQLCEWSTVPVIVLTVRDSDADKVALLDAGADDYLTKPFSVPELMARIRTALRIVILRSMSQSLPMVIWR